MTAAVEFPTFFDRQGKPITVEEAAVEFRTTLADEVMTGPDGRERRVQTMYCASSVPHMRLQRGPKDPPVCWGVLVHRGEHDWSVVKECTTEGGALAWHDAVVALVRVGDVR